MCYAKRLITQLTLTVVSFIRRIGIQISSPLQLSKHKKIKNLLSHTSIIQIRCIKAKAFNFLGLVEEKCRLTQIDGTIWLLWLEKRRWPCRISLVRSLLRPLLCVCHDPWTHTKSCCSFTFFKYCYINLFNFCLYMFRHIKVIRLIFVP